MNTKEKIIQQDWDLYWSGKSKPGSSVYDGIAKFYRKNIIAKFLAHFIRKHFKPGEKLLHAGCGSGQVDELIIDHYQITALDISPNALAIYKSIYGEKCKTVLGSIFSLPFENESFDGVYNLGVMEHFYEDDIQKIFAEFKRVLKPGAFMVILWPPSFGLSVNVLDFAHFMLNKVFRKNIQLHPPEVARITSKKQAKKFIADAGLSFVEYYWGPKDIFTQVVIVARKPA